MATILSGSDRAHSDPAPSTGAVAQEVVGIVSEMVCDWSVNGDEPVGLDTRLVADLECGSVDIIHLVIAIEEHFNRPRMGFQELLMKDNRYVDDLTVGQIAAFVGRKLAG